MIFSLNNLKFEDIKAQIIEFLKSNSEYYATFDFEGSNLNYVIDAMAYVTMNMSYQVANVANNMFIDSTEIRKNAVSIAKTMGYRPRRIIPSRADIEITYIDTTDTFTENSYIKIPVNSIFTSDRGNTYMNPEEITLSFKDKNTLYGFGSVYQGKNKTFTQISNGQPFQSIIIQSDRVSELGFQLYIQDSVTDNPQSILWTELENTFSLQHKNSYIVEEDIANEGFVRILFGDGSILNYPAAGKLINVYYQEAYGDSTNGEFLSSLPSLPVSGYEVKGVTNFLINKLSDTMVLSSNRTYNGSNYESIDGIRNNAPMSYANVGRLVTENDYNAFLQSYKFLSKAKAIGGDVLYPGDTTKLGNIYITGLPATFDGANLQSLYLTDSQEAELSNYIQKFRIISTKVNFFKPSYIYVDVIPKIEVDKHASPEEISLIKQNVYNTLNIHTSSNFNDFNPQFRNSKILSSIDSVSSILSSEIDYNYYFLLGRETFYSSDKDIVNLPLVITGYDSNYNINTCESFIRSNKDNKEFLNFPADEYNDHDRDNYNALDYTVDMSTIYGKLNHDTLSRYVYNVDNIDNISCDIKLYGQNIFANIFNYENHVGENIITDTASALDLTLTLSQPSNVISTYINNSSVSGYYDNYILTTATTTAGTIYRTDSYNNGFKGLVRTATDIPVSGSAGLVTGQFMHCVNNIWIDNRTTNDLDFLELRKNDYIIFNGQKWIKTIDKGTISAVKGISFYDAYPAAVLKDKIYAISGSVTGDIGGFVDKNVTGGDQIIFNYIDGDIPQGQWTKVNWRTGVNSVPPSGGLDASGNIPTIVEPFQIFLITDVDTSTNFGGRTYDSYISEDLIYYNPSATGSESRKWTKICNWENWDTEITKFIDTSYAQLNAITIAPSAVGTSAAYYAVTGDPGNFGGSQNVDWPFGLSEEEQIAVSGDILVYKGEEGGIDKWGIYLQRYSNLYTLDGTNFTSLPISADYGDKFSITVSGTFGDYFTENVSTSDTIIYLGNGTWSKVQISGTIPNASSSSVTALPTPGTIGDTLLVNQDGSFEYDTIPGIFSPSGDKFVQGDYLIFTGNHWTKMREYSIKYETLDLDDYFGKSILNDLGLNCVFDYQYNNTIGQYEFIFYDIYHNTSLGSLNYTAVSGDYSNVGKLIFNEEITGSYWINNNVVGTKTLDLFTNASINKIRIIPKINSLDTCPINDFDTSFDNYIITNINTAEVNKTII